ncbi:MAG: hypothetical protein ABSE22_18965 [Xanthobacteraceae bacterium]|jgi:Fe-S-cluster containining protein
MPVTDLKSPHTQRRSCGSCALCCKLLGLLDSGKMGRWCPHCLKSSGCGIYDSRPEVCRTFNCVWLTDAEFGDEWQPTRSKIVICHVRYGETRNLVFHVDPGWPLSWREEPYYSQLKQFARNGLENNGITTVNVGKRVFVILPNKDVNLGICNVDDQISIKEVGDGATRDLEVSKVPRQAPSE